MAKATCAALMLPLCQSFDPSSTKHTNQEVSKYFHAEDGGHDGGDATEDIEYSSASAQAAARRSQKPNFQHEFQGQGQKKKATADLWERVGAVEGFMV